MTFWDSEKSLDAGVPYELHEFRAGDTSTYWRYADAPADISYGGNTFTACYIKGDPIESGVNAIKSRTTVRTGWNNPFAAQYQICPPDEIIHYTRYKGHGTDVVREYTGDVLQVTFRQDSRAGANRRAEIVIDPFNAALQRTGLVMHYGRQCQVEIYSTACGVDRDSFKELGTLDDVSGNVLTSTVFGGHADGYWVGGDILINSRRRIMVAHSGNTVTVSPGFPVAAAGDGFDAAPGCNHLPTLTGDCHARFNNYVNGPYKGQPFIPDDNPFSQYGIM